MQEFLAGNIGSIRQTASPQVSSVLFILNPFFFFFFNVYGQDFELKENLNYTRLIVLISNDEKKHILLTILDYLTSHELLNYEKSA